MKIIQVIARMNQGGTARWMETLVTGLRELNHEVILLSGSVASNEIEDAAFAQLKARRILGLGRSVSIVKDINCIFFLRRIFKLEKPDLINTHTAKAGALGRLAAIGLPVKIVHTYHGHILYGYFSPFKTKIYVLIEKILALKTDALISVGIKVRDDLIGSGIAAKNKFNVIAPGITLEGLISKNKARLNYSLGGKAFVIGWLGRLVQIKRPDILIDIAKKLPDVTFLVGGAGELENLVTSSNLENVKFIGWAKPEEFWPACNLALLTSDNEGLPTALIEAALCEIPIIARNVGSVSETFLDKSGGFLFEDSIGAASRILDFINLDEDLERAGTAAREFATTNFSKELFIQKHIDLYESLI